MARAHQDYSRWANMRRQVNGHLWQNRFYSCALDEGHQWEALRYIELNPLRAGMVERAEQWRWSSARAHMTGADPDRLLTMEDWWCRWSPQSWRETLACGISDAAMFESIREATRTGRPAAEKDFICRIEQTTGRQILPLRRGPKPKATALEGQLNLVNS